MLDGVLLFGVARLGQKQLWQLCVAMLMVLGAYAASCVLDSLSLAGMAAWASLTCTALAWSISTEPRARAHVVRMLVSILGRVHTRFQGRSVSQAMNGGTSCKGVTRESSQ